MKKYVWVVSRLGNTGGIVSTVKKDKINGHILWYTSQPFQSFPTYEAARNAVRRTLRYDKKKNLDWEELLGRLCIQRILI